MSEKAMSQRELTKFLGLLPISDPFKMDKITLHQKQAILLHLEGLPPKQIAEELGKSPDWVSRVLRSKKAEELINNYLSFADQEFKVLYSLSINAVRDALNSSDVKVRLDAAKIYLKAHGKDGASGPASGVGETAEDVITRVIELQMRVIEEKKVPSSQPLQNAATPYQEKNQEKLLPQCSNIEQKVERKKPTLTLAGGKKDG